MNIKEQLCQAFCSTLTVSTVPAGLAIGTQYDGLGGDPIGVYVIGPDSAGMYHVQDDGITMPTLESMGADLENKTRRGAFEELLHAYSVVFDDANGELKSETIAEEQVAPTVMRFLAFMLRLQDLAMMAAERAANTFRDDALAKLKQIVGTRATLEPKFVIAESLSDYPADVGIIVPGKPPIALFWGITEGKVYEALLLQAYAQSENVECSVVTMIENSKVLSAKMVQRAANHLDASPFYRGDETQACLRVLRSALGSSIEQSASIH